MSGEPAGGDQDREVYYARRTGRALVWLEDAIYILAALLLGLSAIVVLGKSIYDVVTEIPKGVLVAVETSFEGLLIVFILVELLAAVRIAITEHELVGEPFLLVGILAAIKELVGLATFKIDDADAAQTAIKIGVLAGVILVLAVATLILRRREREPKEAKGE